MIRLKHWIKSWGISKGFAVRSSCRGLRNDRWGETPLPHLLSGFTGDWMKQRHKETLSSLLSLTLMGGLSSPASQIQQPLCSAFPVPSHPSLMRGGVIYMNLERPASASLQLGLSGSPEVPAGSLPPPSLWMGVR